MDGKKVLEKWLEAFAADVDRKFMGERVLSSGNYLWHVFSWEAVPCLVGDDARAAFDAQEYDEAIMFKSGFSWCEDKLTNQAEAALLENLHYTEKVTAEDIEKYNDTYIVAKDFSWTYVHTHEEMCGPYFLKLQ